jgi:hypothetical protein
MNELASGTETLYTVTVVIYTLNSGSTWLPATLFALKRCGSYEDARLTNRTYDCPY